MAEDGLTSLLGMGQRSQQRQRRRERRADRKDMFAQAAIGILGPSIQSGVTSLINAPFREPIRKFIELNPQGRQLNSVANKLFTERKTIGDDIKKQNELQFTDEEFVRHKAYEVAQAELQSKYNKDNITAFVKRPDVEDLLEKQGIDFKKEAGEWNKTKSFYHTMPYSTQKEYYEYLKRGSSHPDNWGTALFGKVKRLFKGQSYEDFEQERLADHYTNLLGFTKDSATGEYSDGFGNKFSTMEEAISKENIGRVLSSLRAGSKVLGVSQGREMMNNFVETTESGRALQSLYETKQSEILTNMHKAQDTIGFQNALRNNEVSKRATEVYFSLTDDEQKNTTLASLSARINTITNFKDLQPGIMASFRTTKSPGLRVFRERLLDTIQANHFADMTREQMLGSGNNADFQKIYMEQYINPIFKRVHDITNVYGATDSIFEKSAERTGVPKEVFESQQIVSMLEKLINDEAFEIQTLNAPQKRSAGKTLRGFLGFGKPSTDFQQIYTREIDLSSYMNTRDTDEERDIRQEIEEDLKKGREDSVIQQDSVPVRQDQVSDSAAPEELTFEVNLQSSIAKLQSDDKDSKKQAIKTVMEKTYKNDLSNNPNRNSFSVGMNIVNKSKSTDPALSDNRKILSKAIVDAKDAFMSQPFVEAGNKLTADNTSFEIANNGQLNIEVFGKGFFGGDVKAELYNDIPDGNIKNYIRYLAVEHNKLNKTNDPSGMTRRNLENLIDLPDIIDNKTIRGMFKIANKEAQELVGVSTQEDNRDSILAKPSVDMDSIASLIKSEEGLLPTVSADSFTRKDGKNIRNPGGKNVPHSGGYGHLLTAAERIEYPLGSEIPQEQIDKWFEEDLIKAYEAAVAQNKQLSTPLDIGRLTAVNFQLGTDWYKDHKETWKALVAGNYDVATEEIKERSKWYTQTPARAESLINSFPTVES